MVNGETGIGKGVEDFRFREPALCQGEHSCPGDPMFLAPTADGMPPVNKQLVPEHAQASRVTGYRVVVEVASHDRFEPLAGLGQGIVHSLAELRLDASELGPHPLGDRLAPNCKPSKAVLPADMREAQKIKRFGLTFPSSFPVLFGVPPEFDPARLIRVQLQSKLSQPLP